ncbi:MAG: DUF21 domain-containing protein [Planctomycetes bacterium]|nr:DUF21 domain-containing protein [Planctomycetota bacterium]
MDWVLVLMLLAASLFFSAFFSGAETGLYCVDRVRVHVGAQERRRRAMRLASVLDDEQGALASALVGTNVANYVATASVAYLFAELLGLGAVDSEVYTVVLVTPLLLVLGEVVPKSLFQRHPDRLMMLSSGLLALANRLLRIIGVVWLLKGVAAVVHRAVGLTPARDRETVPRRRIAALLREALAGAPLADDHSELVERVFQLSETPLHRVMVPRNRITSIPAHAGRREVFRAARRTRHARLPVYETNPRHIIGIVRVDELLRSEDWSTVKDCLHPPLTLSPHETVASATARMQAEQRKIAIVTDRSGQMLGLVTLQDLVEEVVGEFAENV